MAEEHGTSEEVFDYTLTRKELKFKIKDGAGRIGEWRLVELLGTERDEFIAQQEGRVLRDKKGNVTGVKDSKGIIPGLLAKCLYTPEGVLVPRGDVMHWPAGMQMDLFLKALSLSGLDKKGEEEAKND